MSLEDNKTKWRHNLKQDKGKKTDRDNKQQQNSPLLWFQDKNKTKSRKIKVEKGGREIENEEKKNELAYLEAFSLLRLWRKEKGVGTPNHKAQEMRIRNGEI